MLECDVVRVCWSVLEGQRDRSSTYTTVGTVCASALLGSLVDLDVLDNQGTGVEALGIGVGLSVAEEDEDVLGGLDGPAGTGDTELLAYRNNMSVPLYIFTSIEPVHPNHGVCPMSGSFVMSSKSRKRRSEHHCRIVPWAVRPVPPA